LQKPFSNLNNIQMILTVFQLLGITIVSAIFGAMTFYALIHEMDHQLYSVLLTSVALEISAASISLGLLVMIVGEYEHSEKYRGRYKPILYSKHIINSYNDWIVVSVILWLLGVLLQASYVIWSTKKRFEQPIYAIGIVFIMVLVLWIVFRAVNYFYHKR